MDKTENWQENMQRVMEKLTPEGYMDPGLAGATEVAPAFAEVAGEVIMGKFMSDPTIDLKTRAFCALSALMALGNRPAIKTWTHFLNNLGCSRKEINALVCQIGWYIGAPQTMVVCNAIKEVYEEIDS